MDYITSLVRAMFSSIQTIQPVPIQIVESFEANKQKWKRNNPNKNALLSQQLASSLAIAEIFANSSVLDINVNVYFYLLK